MMKWFGGFFVSVGFVCVFFSVTWVAGVSLADMGSSMDTGVQKDTANNWTAPQTIVSSFTVIGSGISYSTSSTSVLPYFQVVGGNGLLYIPSLAAVDPTTPLRAGALAWNSTDGQLCVSTGNVAGAWVQAIDGTTDCSH